MTAALTELSDDALDRLRAPHAGVDEVHLNHAGVAPACDAAVRAGSRALEAMRRGTLAVPSLLAEYEHARSSYARLVGAAREDVSFLQTAAAAISQVAFGLTLKRGAEIVRLDQEYPSNAYPWHRAAERAGAQVVVVKSEPDFSVDTQRLVAAIGERTQVVAVSWVQFQTGAMVDIAPVVARAHQVGAVVCVDAIQGLGVAPFDMQALGVDYVCSGTHKWVLGMLGHGFLVADAARRALLEPLAHGAMTYGTPDDPVDPGKGARADRHRFEPGTPLVVGAVAGAAAIDELLAIGIDRVNAEARAIASLVKDGAAQRGWRVLPSGHESPIVTFLPKDPAAAHARLLAANVSVAKRAGGLRIAPHCTNTKEHVARLFAVLDAR